METRTFFLFGVLFCVFCAIISETSAGGGGGGKWKEMMKKCGDGEINVEEATKGKDECMKEMKGTKNEEKRRRRSPQDDGGDGGKKKKKRGGKGFGFMKNSCVMVCMLKKSGMLDEPGQFSESGAQGYVDRVYPESKRSEAMTKVKQCATDHSSKFSMDNNCAGYKDFNGCIKKGHMAICGISFGGKGGKGKGKGGGGGGGEGGDEE